MRRFIFAIASMALLASCGGVDRNDPEKYAYRTQCPKDEMYHKHDWRWGAAELSSSTTELGYENWINESCVKCGLMRKFTLDACCTDYNGKIVLYKSPETGKYDDLCVSINYDGENEELFPIEESQLKPSNEL